MKEPEATARSGERRLFFTRRAPTTEDKRIKDKLGPIGLGSELENVSRACKVLGYFRGTFRRWKEAHETGGEEALKELPRRKPD